MPDQHLACTDPLLPLLERRKPASETAIVSKAGVRVMESTVLNST